MVEISGLKIEIPRLGRIRMFSARGAEVRAIGTARAEAFKKQVNALGQENTAMVNMITVLAEKNLKFVPEIMSGDNGNLGGLMGLLMKKLSA